VFSSCTSPRTLCAWRKETSRTKSSRASPCLASSRRRPTSQAHSSSTTSLPRSVAQLLLAHIPVRFLRHAPAIYVRGPPFIPFIPSYLSSPFQQKSIGVIKALTDNVAFARKRIVNPKTVYRYVRSRPFASRTLAPTAPTDGPCMQPSPLPSPLPSLLPSPLPSPISSPLSPVLSQWLVRCDGVDRSSPYRPRDLQGMSSKSGYECR
jgi:hypothetical protein